jgi:hypothetical protein
MPSALDRLQHLWNQITAGSTKLRSQFWIQQDHIDGLPLGPPFAAGQHYLQIIISEMFLANQRQWYARYDPMAFVASTYIYGNSQETFPKVVGPSLLKDLEQPIPLGMIFKNTPASSLHPYQGGEFAMTVVLNAQQRQNNADKLLRVVESLSRVMDPTGTVAMYAKLASTLLDSVEELIGLGQTNPVVGCRLGFNPAVGQTLTPGYLALIDEDEARIDPSQFWLKDSQLLCGRDASSARPYRDNDFVLLKIAQGTQRSDERTLPFYPLWETTQDLAARPEPHYWNEAKANFNALKRAMLVSPDVTRPDALRLLNGYLARLKDLRTEAVMESELGHEALPQDEVEMQRMTAQINRLDTF